MSLRQENATSRDTVRAKTMGQLLCSLLAALVGIDIEGEIDGARRLRRAGGTGRR